MADTRAPDTKGSRWTRSSRHRRVEPARPDPATVVAREVHHRLLLSNVRCAMDGAADSIAAIATAQLVLTNDSPHAIEYQVESVKVTIQQRIAETSDAARAVTVAPGTASIVRCPSIRAVDRTSPSSGSIDYVIVYGHADAPPALRYRRQHGVWFRIEANADELVRVRFVERYDEDDPAS